MPITDHVPIHSTTHHVLGVGAHVVHGIVSVLPLPTFVHVIITHDVPLAGFGEAIHTGTAGAGTTTIKFDVADGDVCPIASVCVALMIYVPVESDGNVTLHVPLGEIVHVTVIILAGINTLIIAPGSPVPFTTIVPGANIAHGNGDRIVGTPGTTLSINPVNTDHVVHVTHWQLTGVYNPVHSGCAGDTGPHAYSPDAFAVVVHNAAHERS